MSDLVIDAATWDPELIAIAKLTGAKAICGYAYDPWLTLTNGWPGGWTPAAVAAVYASGLEYRAVVTTRNGVALPTAEQIIGMLHQQGLRVGGWVHDDLENGAMPATEWVAGCQIARRAVGWRNAPYGTPSTLSFSGYTRNADAEWLASWVLNGAYRPVPAMKYPGNAWQYANAVVTNGVAYDVSLSDLPSGLVAATSGVATAPMLQEIDMENAWVLSCVGQPDQLVTEHNGTISIPDAATLQAIQAAYPTVKVVGPVNAEFYAATRKAYQPNN